MLRMTMIAVLIFLSCASDTRKSGDAAAPPTAAGLFARDRIATGLNERDAAFTPDGRMFYYTVQHGNAGTIVFTEKTGSGWSEPEVAPFSGRFSDVEPFITPDGSRFYFASNRPLDGSDTPKDYDIWFMQWKDGCWSDPENPGLPVNTENNEFFPTLTRDNTLIFTGKRDGQRDEDIFRSRWTGDKFDVPEKMDAAVNSPGEEFNAMISPDDSVLIFTAWGRKDFGGGDLYISFRQPDGTWHAAMNMGPAVNSPALDYCPALSPDGKALFFTSRRASDPDRTKQAQTYSDLVAEHNNPQNGNSDIYWISASVIDSLKQTL
ncbi:PD40 domain-containing protein [bacterium]|nr:PD40 domain-containing protein [bacterium]